MVICSVRDFWPEFEGGVTACHWVRIKSYSDVNYNFDLISGFCYVDDEFHQLDVPGFIYNKDFNRHELAPGDAIGFKWF